MRSVTASIRPSVGAALPSVRIGRHCVAPALGLAPMAGVTDSPFRRLCRTLGAGLATSEMVAANPALRHTRKSLERISHAGEPGPISVQIAGALPQQLAAAARYNVERGADIIDINMGCPAKKVCRLWAGSALMRDELLVARILAAVVAAVEVPVTLKIRTGWDQTHRNGLSIARIAEDCGIAALAVHGRTRDQKYTGQAEYDTIAEIAADVSIPVWANGDIDSPEKARRVLDYTGAAGVLIGRAAQGRPWIFRDIAHFLATGQRLPEPTPGAVCAILLEHLEALCAFYGESRGVRIARKHLAWYAGSQPDSATFRASINRAQSAAEQRLATRDYFAWLARDGGGGAGYAANDR
ncbi:MAG: tRNA dihydrouridine synthase DusB [Pseudomonadota bacterium]|nr:MAG: tRNA dihydrouridine synthase DusB [Pseudomonadota bacterium]